MMNLYAYISNKPYMMDHLGNDAIKLEYHFINQKSDINTWISEQISNAKYNKRIEKQSEFNPNEKCSAKDCISHLIINAHGDFYERQGISVIFLNTSDGEIQNLTETVNTDQMGISNFINNANIKFCKNAILELNICYIGLNTQIAKRIKKNYKDINLNVITHTRVVMPGGIENYIKTFAATLYRLIYEYNH